MANVRARQAPISFVPMFAAAKYSNRVRGLWYNILNHNLILAFFLAHFFMKKMWSKSRGEFPFKS
jgi:hypothetical protein